MPEDASDLRIIHVLRDVTMRGSGIVNVAVDLACTQRALGNEVWVVSEGGKYEALLEDYGVHHVAIEHRSSPASFVGAVSALDRVVRDSRPDIVHAHMMTAALLARAVRFRRRFGLVTTVHNSWQRGSSAMMVGDRVIAVSEAVADDLRRRRLRSKRIRVVLNGPLASPRSGFGSGDHPPELKRPSIVTVAGMYERKGIGDLIDAFAIVRRAGVDAHLYLVGDGPDREIFKKRAEVAGVAAHTHFELFQPRPQDYLSQADVFVLASHADPNPLVVPEARMEGCAIVASNAGGMIEALDGGRAGHIFPAGDVAALSEALLRIIKDPAERARLQIAARQGIAWLTVDRMTLDTIRVYEELLIDKLPRSSS